MRGCRSSLYFVKLKFKNMACDNLLTANIVFDCADAPKKGLDGGKIVLINWADVDWSATTLANGVVTDLTLLSGKTGYSCDFYKDLATASGTYNASTEDYDGFGHAVMCRLPNSSGLNQKAATELKNGKFIAVVETKYKGTAKADAFKVLGIGNGLRLTEGTWNSDENSGAIMFTLATQEGDVEEAPFNIFLETDYATSKASFDSLFATV